MAASVNGAVLTVVVVSIDDIGVRAAAIDDVAPVDDNITDH